MYMQAELHINKAQENARTPPLSEKKYSTDFPTAQMLYKVTIPAVLAALLLQAFSGTGVAAEPLPQVISVPPAIIDCEFLRILENRLN